MHSLLYVGRIDIGPIESCLAYSYTNRRSWTRSLIWALFVRWWWTNARLNMCRSLDSTGSPHKQITSDSNRTINWSISASAVEFLICSFVQFIYHLFINIIIYSFMYLVLLHWSTPRVDMNFTVPTPGGPKNRMFFSSFFAYKLSVSGENFSSSLNALAQREWEKTCRKDVQSFLTLCFMWNSNQNALYVV